MMRPPSGFVTVDVKPYRRSGPVARYPNIGDHGLIGDLQTAALVSTDGVLDWFCCPRFDSPSVFASLLDAGRGGFYRGHRLVRNIRVVRGTMRFAIEFQPRFGYGRLPHKLDLSRHGAVFAADGLELTV